MWVKLLRNHLSDRDHKFGDLEATINLLKLETQQKDDLIRELENIRNQPYFGPIIGGISAATAPFGLTGGIVGPLGGWQSLVGKLTVQGGVIINPQSEKNKSE